MPFNLLLLLLLFRVSDQMTVQTQWGPISVHPHSVGEGVVLAFKNIPYTKPPVGDLRFKITEREPRRLPKDLSWNTTWANTSIVCPQPSFYDNGTIRSTFVGDEDCLYLDVYMQKHVENANLPVIIYFHGGGFVRGSKEEYGPDFLLRFANVVLVVPNYRLGILGFLKSKDEQLMPGNLGLWDQYLVLRWVKQNIHLLGGDPKKVTIAGHEAGGVAVGLHLQSSVSWGFFRRAISISGSAFSPSLIDFNRSNNAFFKVTNDLKCFSSFKTEIFKCLQEADLSQLMTIQMNLKNGDTLPTVGINSQNPFALLDHGKVNLKRQQNINYLLAYAENEAALEVARSFPTVLKFQNLDKMIGYYLKPYFENVVNFDEIVKAVKYHYLKGLFIPSFEYMESQITTMLTDFLYKSPIEHTIRHHGRGKTFLYVFKTERPNLCGPLERECYGDEFYLFNKTVNTSNFYGNIYVGERMLISKILAKIWESFADIGYPDAPEKWKPWNNSTRIYAEISDVIQVKQSPSCEDTDFWSSLVLDLKRAQNGTNIESFDIQLHSGHSSVGSWGAAGLTILCAVLCVALIGLVVITKRRTSAILPISSPKEVRMIEWT